MTTQRVARLRGLSFPWFVLISSSVLLCGDLVPSLRAGESKNRVDRRTEGTCRSGEASGVTPGSRWRDVCTARRQGGRSDASNNAGFVSGLQTCRSSRILIEPTRIAIFRSGIWRSLPPILARLHYAGLEPKPVVVLVEIGGTNHVLSFEMQWRMAHAGHSCFFDVRTWFHSTGNGREKELWVPSDASAMILRPNITRESD